MGVVVYKRRQPEKSALHAVISRNLPQFLAATDEAQRPVPRYVINEFERYLDCGILERGFVRVRCGQCGFDRLVAFSCKGRGFCSSCLGRQMADTSTHLVDRIFPRVPVRQWTLSLPFPLRFRLAWDTSLCSAILAAFLQTVFRWLCWTAKRELGIDSVRLAHGGAVTSIQRCSSTLALNPHFHALVPDGVFVVGADENAAPMFRAIRAPTDAEVTEIAWNVCRRTVRILEKRGLWTHDTDTLADDGALEDREPGLAHLYAMSIQGRLSLGPKVGGRLLRLRGEAGGSDQRQAAETRGYGFNLHCRSRVSASDRKGLERLCRYVTRPPFAAGRLELLPDGRVRLGLKRAFQDGTTHIVFDALDFLAKLAALVWPPRTNRLRYHGVFAPNSKLRKLVVPEPPGDDGSAPCQPELIQATSTRSKQRPGWAKMMARVFEIDVLECPRCSGGMQQIAFITEHRVIMAILRSLELARGPPARTPRVSATQMPLRLAPVG